jgi:hypothetical protein
VNVGGPAAAGFQPDTGFVGGTIISTTQIVNNVWVHGATAPNVYQTARTGESTYTATGLAANTVYTVRLHFADIQQTQVGKRQFNVRIQNNTVLQDLDIIGSAGIPFRAMVKEFIVTSDAAGTIKVEFLRGTVGDPIINGIEILDQIASLVTEAPITGPAPGSYIETQVVTLASRTPGAVIYYTLDGSTPTTSSLRYNKPIVITQTATIRSIAMAPGFRPSEVAIASFAIQPRSTPYRINFGGPAVAGFTQDLYTTGYTKTLTHTRPINTTAPGAGPAEIYQTGTTIWADYDMWSILPNLEPGKTYTLRLHFAEPTYFRAGDRRFDVWVNGQKRISLLDVAGESGGRDIALVKDLTVQADLSGRIYLFLEGASGSTNRSVLLNALEVIDPAP